MISKKYSSLLLLFLLIFSSCSSIEIFKENTETPIQKRYQSFVLVNQEVGMRGFKAQFIDKKVQIRIQELLEAEGLTYDKENPDLVIRYTSNEEPRERTTTNYPSSPYWGYRVWDPWAYSNFRNDYGPKTTNYELLQVIVDFIEPSQDKFIMTLTGVTEVSSKKSKEKKVIKSVDKIMEKFIFDMSTETQSVRR
ncbi:DUF4136 domain-containing protein [Algoriphagus machipongonensis]|uniref:DUF4136 domain-containing protein n=1 Tax=Algoriphagus machipongonensis TaxID=388413 RepID=UPI0000F37A88|nr:DUF4136 domain-containing protein [Algoriphagus machipongonensis]